MDRKPERHFDRPALGGGNSPENLKESAEFYAAPGPAANAPGSIRGGAQIPGKGAGHLMTRMIGRRTVFGLAGAAAFAGVVGVSLIVSGVISLDLALRRALFLGAPTLEVRSPRAAEVYAPGGVPVLVAYIDAQRIAPGTLRCLLNGRDVTHQLTLGSNGAAGRVYPAREGRNSFRVEVYAQGLWTSRYFEDSIEVDFRVRAAQRLDQT